MSIRRSASPLRLKRDHYPLTNRTPLLCRYVLLSHNLFSGAISYPNHPKAQGQSLLAQWHAYQSDDWYMSRP